MELNQAAREIIDVSIIYINKIKDSVTVSKLTLSKTKSMFLDSDLPNLCDDFDPKLLEEALDLVNRWILNIRPLER